VLCSWKSNTANEQTYPIPSTCTVNSRKKSMIAAEHGGREKNRIQGVKRTERSSVKNTVILSWNIVLNSVWT